LSKATAPRDRIAIRLEDPGTPEVAALMAALDAYQAALYPPESNHFLGLEELRRDNVRFFVARDGDRAVACGALRVYPDYGEIKRMYVHSGSRGLGLGARMLATLEATARDHGLRLLRLETGIAQPEALELYRSHGFHERAAFGDYASDPLSLYFEKTLG
jgi:putative acetyltransferase